MGDYVEALRLGHINSDQYYRYMSEIGFSHNQAKIAYFNQQTFATTAELVQKRYNDNLARTLTLTDSEIELKQMLDNSEINQATYNTKYEELQTEYKKDIEKIEKDFCDSMYGLGYTEMQSKKVFNALRPSATFSQILEFVAKEAFEPKVIETFGLNEDYPKTFADFMSTLGVPENEARKYWVAHWNHPAPGQIGDMYARLRATRTDISLEDLENVRKDGESDSDLLGRMKITRDEFTEMLKLHELPAYWRDKLILYSFRPLPLTTLQQGYVYGLKPDSWFLGRLKDYGYSDGNAEFILSIWRKKFLYSSKAPLISNYFLGFIRGELTETEVKNHLTSQGVPPGDITFFINQALDKRVYAVEKRLITAAQTRFRKDELSETELDVITRDIATQVLIMQGNTAMQITSTPALLSKRNSRAETLKEIIKAGSEGAFSRIGLRDIRTGLKDGTLSENAARAKLEDLRLLDEDIDLIISIYTANQGAS